MTRDALPRWLSSLPRLPRRLASSPPLIRHYLEEHSYTMLSVHPAFDSGPTLTHGVFFVQKTEYDYFLAGLFRNNTHC